MIVILVCGVNNILVVDYRTSNTSCGMITHNKKKHIKFSLKLFEPEKIGPMHSACKNVSMKVVFYLESLKKKCLEVNWTFFFCKKICLYFS